jgi:all-trans-retinol dehydrogenase (NAD+)
VSEIANQNVLITGGAGGLGMQIAREVARRGGHPVLWDIHEANLDRARKDLEKQTGRAVFVDVVDVSDREAIYAAAKRVRAEVGPIGILVNNAGVVSGQPFLDVPDEKIQTTFDVNALALFWTAKAFLPDMIGRNAGHVVTIASAAGLIGVARMTDYAASKWAAVGFDESLRVELRHQAPGVKTTVVCPYFIDTGMFEGVKSRFPSLLPILREEDVGKRVVEAIAANRSRLWMPPLVNLVPPLRILPVAIFDAVADFLGINVAMEGFVGRTAPKKARRGGRPALRIAEGAGAAAPTTAAKRTRRPRT